MNPEIFPTWVLSILKTHKHERVARQLFEGFQLVLESKQPQIASQNTLAFFQTKRGRRTKKRKEEKKKRKRKKKKESGTDPVSI